VSLSQSHIKSSKMRRSGVQQGVHQLNTQLHNLMLKNRQAEREIQEVRLVSFHQHVTITQVSFSFKSMSLLLLFFFLGRKMKRWKQKLNTCFKPLTIKWNKLRYKLPETNNEVCVLCTRPVSGDVCVHASSHDEFMYHPALKYNLKLRQCSH